MRAQRRGLSGAAAGLQEVCKRRGFVFPNSESYGGVANSFDYGPLGCQMKKNVKDLWWSEFIEMEERVEGMDSGIMMNPKVWEATGHVDNFSDPLVECLDCHHRVRVDQWLEELGIPVPSEIMPSTERMNALHDVIQNAKLACPSCRSSRLSKPLLFNLLFETHQGSVVNSAAATMYLRPETAQGIFVNFPHIIRSRRSTIPFGIGQIGKAFRNEIAPRHFLFRTREFEQMEIEMFIHPSDATYWFQFYVDKCQSFLHTHGIRPELVRLNQHSAADLAFYSTEAVDIDFKFEHGWGELWGIANRTDYDLQVHHSATKDKGYLYQDPRMFDNNSNVLNSVGTNERFFPYVIEPSVGLDRLVLAFLTNAHHVESIGASTRSVMKLHPSISPIQIGIFPLIKSNPEMVEMSRALYRRLSRSCRAEYDSAGSIGKRYRRHDEIGTPFCVCVDPESLRDHAVTVRFRDSMDQIRIPMEQLESKCHDMSALLALAPGTQTKD